MQQYIVNKNKFKLLGFYLDTVILEELNSGLQLNFTKPFADEIKKQNIRKDECFYMNDDLNNVEVTRC